MVEMLLEPQLKLDPRGVTVLAMACENVAAVPLIFDQLEVITGACFKRADNPWM